MEVLNIKNSKIQVALQRIEVSVSCLKLKLYFLINNKKLH